jgi:hypothetical protein
MTDETEHPSCFAWLSQLPPDAIERRLGDLIRYYVRWRSPAVAQSVVSHIEALCAHPQFEGGASERCAYLRLRSHWRWLAQTGPSRQTAH